MFQPSSLGDIQQVYGSPTGMTRPELPDLTPQVRQGAAWGSALYVAMSLSSMTAMALSYQRNKSIPWAIGAGFVGLPYLIYRAIDRE